MNKELEALTIEQAEQLARDLKENQPMQGLFRNVLEQLADTMRDNARLERDLEDERIHRRTCAKRIKVALEFLQAESEQPKKD